MLSVLISTDPRYPVNRKVIREAVSQVFKDENIESLNAQVSVLVCGSRKMRELSKKYLSDEIDHEVLSFPLQEQKVKSEGYQDDSDETLRLGDVVVCWPIILKLAAQDNVFVDEKLAFLVSHGVEHLLGKHHDE